MNRLLLRTKARLRDVAKPVAEAAVGALTVALLRTTRYFDPDKTANFFGRVTRFIGRRLREDRIGRENLTAAFPEKSPEEIETILAGVWDNLGRIGAEFAHLDHIWDYDVDHPDKPSRVEFGARTKQIFDHLRDDGKPAIIFASHLGNWKFPRSARSPMGWIARSCSAGPTSNPPTAPSNGSAPSRWARWCRPAAKRRSSWRRRCKGASTSRCWSISTWATASR